MDSSGRAYINGKLVVVDRAAYNAYFAAYRAKNRVKWRQYRKKYNKEWRKKHGYHNEENSANRYPDKVRARKKLRYAVSVGRVAKLPCSVCGTTRKVQANHDDYTKPLDVQWFCPLHHAIHEKRAFELR